MANSKASTATPKDARRAALAKMTKARLISMCRTGITTPDGRRVVIEGGMYPLTAWSRDDLISSIMSAEFPAEDAPADLLLCDCGARLPWPTRTEDVTCPYCGNTWEHDGVDLGAGARLKVPASGPLSVACPSCSAPRGGQCTGSGFCLSRMDAAAGVPDDDRPDVPSQWVGHSDDLVPESPAEHDDLGDDFVADPHYDPAVAWAAGDDEPEPGEWTEYRCIGCGAAYSALPFAISPHQCGAEPGPEAGASREYPVTLADHQWTPGPDGECIHCSRSEADHEPFGEVSPAASEAKFTIDTADPSWFPRVLRTLARDYPEINDQVWSTAIGENASELSERRAFIAVNEPVREPEPGTIIGTDVRIAYDDQDDEPEEEPPVEEYDPGPEVDDEGGMSEYRHHEPEPWS